MLCLRQLNAFRLNASYVGIFTEQAGCLASTDLGVRLSVEY
jgi:hypothetical protein